MLNIYIYIFREILEYFSITFCQGGFPEDGTSMWIVRR